MSHSYELLKASSDQCHWTPDVDMLVLGGFILRSYPDLNPDKFSEATGRYCFEAGLPLELLKRAFCAVVDDMPIVDPKQPNQVSSFAIYLAGVVAEFRKTSQSAEESITVSPSLQVSVPADVGHDIYNFLKSDRPLTDAELGDIMFRWNAKLDDKELYLEVINAEPTPVLAITVVERGRTVLRHRPIRAKQWGEIPGCPEGRKLTVTLTSVQIEIIFLHSGVS